MREIESLLQPHKGMSFIDYLNNSGTANERVWGTGVETIAACSLLKTDIYTHTKVGNVYKWHNVNVKWFSPRK